MKKINIFPAFILLILLFQSCQQEENVPPRKGNVTFSLSQTTIGNGRVSEEATPAFVLLTIERPDGEVVERDTKLALYQFGESYISENLPLYTADYRLTQFMILNNDRKVIYATPTEDSPLAGDVSDPLPIIFSIKEHHNTMVTPEVLEVAGQTPTDFGYASFSFRIVQPKGRIKKIVFKEHWVEVVNELHFNYAQGKVQNVRWLIFTESDHPLHWSVTFLEKRSYLADGLLGAISIDGDTLCENGECRPGDFSWNLTYEYRDGLRYKIHSARETSITTIFTEYDGAKPVAVENLYGVYSPFDPSVYPFPHHTALKFDAGGNLIHQKDTEIPGFDGVVHERAITYSTESNPLRNLIELPFRQGVETHNDLAFYYSAHLPVSVEANYPYVNPKYNRITSFEYQKDDLGRVVQIRAINSAWSEPLRYTLDITYY